MVETLKEPTVIGLALACPASLGWVATPIRLWSAVAVVRSVAPVAAAQVVTVGGVFAMAVEAAIKNSSPGVLAVRTGHATDRSPIPVTDVADVSDSATTSAPVLLRARM